MFRFSSIRRALCLVSVTALLAACANTPNHGSQHAQSKRNAYAQRFDAHYGMPPNRPSVNQNPSHLDKPTPARAKIAIQPNAPTSYTVKKGDTLWSIARKFLINPWQWPEIWDKNQKIKNPHQIYPGDVIYFYPHGMQTADKQGIRIDQTNTTRLSPRIRVERKGRVGTPIATLANFLPWPRLMTESAIKQAPYVLESRDGHRLVSPGETLYAKNLRNPRAGQRFAIYQPAKPLHNPENGALLGHQVKYIGIVRIENNDAITKLTLLEAFEPVRPGDRLLPIEQSRADLRAPIQIPQQKIRGQVLGLYDAQYISANYQSIIMNRGNRHGIRPGYTVGIYRDGRSVKDAYQPYKGTEKDIHTVELPPEKVANAIVYMTEDNLSYAIIMDASREVKNGDRIGNP